MELPLFYAPGIQETSGQYALDENASRHCLHSLRKKTGDEVLLTDGNGKKFRGSISGITAGRCTVELICTELVHLPAYPYPSIAIPIPGNNSRWEWLVEKAVEIGISGIHPLKTGRSLKANLKETRIRQIMVSAMIQSRQYILPQLNPVQAFGDFISRDREGPGFIAHCMEGNRGPVPEKLDRGEKS
ncbi:MAG TPA: RsmE family RNA methyltransferase, partial [Chitinophagaceae bacterium]|nr:RsmE family RNA methyltransferase [Chitinophagaceae bacterium]